MDGIVNTNHSKSAGLLQPPGLGNYAAITQNEFGKGVATYIGCMTTAFLTEKIVKDVLQKASVWKINQQLYFPVITKSGINGQGKIRYYFNYSAFPQKILYTNKNGNELISNKNISTK